MAMGIKEIYSLILYYAFAYYHQVKFSWPLLYGFLCFFVPPYISMGHSEYAQEITLEIRSLVCLLALILNIYSSSNHVVCVFICVFGEMAKKTGNLLIGVRFRQLHSKYRVQIIMEFVFNAAYLEETEFTFFYLRSLTLSLSLPY